jgi:hypothetical protein
MFDPLPPPPPPPVPSSQKYHGGLFLEITAFIMEETFKNMKGYPQTCQFDESVKLIFD